MVKCKQKQIYRPRRQVKSCKFAYRISDFKRRKLHQNYIKSPAKPSYNIFTFTCVVSYLYECLHFFHVVAVFQMYKVQFDKTKSQSCPLIVAMLQHSGRFWRCLFCKQKRSRFPKIFKI